MKSETLLNNSTHVVAAGGVSSPLFLPHLEALSNMSALWMPILGSIWLLVQIGRALLNAYKGKD